MAFRVAMGADWDGWPSGTKDISPNSPGCDRATCGFGTLSALAHFGYARSGRAWTGGIAVLMTGILMGLGGTVAMDLWALILERAGVQGRPDWAMPGRWLGHVPRGRLFHDDIGRAAVVRGERGLGWALHYGVGIVYGVVFVALAGAGWMAEKPFLPVWAFSIATIAAGWFLLQPGMGLGWAASRTAAPGRARIMGLVAHTVFGLGMWGTALAL